MLQSQHLNLVREIAKTKKKKKNPKNKTKKTRTIEFGVLVLERMLMPMSKRWGSLGPAPHSALDTTR